MIYDYAAVSGIGTGASKQAWAERAPRSAISTQLRATNL
jgi:hypothetical protein